MSETTQERSGRWPQLLERWRAGLWSWRLPPQRKIRLVVGWPLLLTPFLLFGQVVTPHPVWVVSIVSLLVPYTLGYVWLRSQVLAVTFTRQRQGTLLVAGDRLREDFALTNRSGLPLQWAAFVDGSDLPGYAPGSVIACAPNGDYRWWKEAECAHRGIFRLGPHRLEMGDPFGLFQALLDYPDVEHVLIYPRVVQLPQIDLPRGSASGHAPRRRSLIGQRASASVRDYTPGDSMRLVHWPTSAHRGRLTVKELELEPSGDVWIVLDLNAAVQRGEGSTGTLEYAVMLAASLAAEMVSGNERRAVGLLTVSGDAVTTLAPQPGQAQLWAILRALAPALASPIPLDALLQRSLSLLGRRHTLVVITPAVGEDAPRWIAELVRAQGQGLASSVVAVTTPDDETAATAALHLLESLAIPYQVMRTDVRLRAALTYRRTRKVIRSTPTGGAFTVEVEEEVG